MNIEDFLATSGGLCIRLQVGPGYDDVVEIDQLYFDANKQDLLDWCLNLPEVEGMSWRQLKGHTGGNGLMAKVLIALGDLAGAWSMYPAPGGVGLWTARSPRILEMAIKPLPRVPKPSAGHLSLIEPCFCCERPMGPVDDYRHDLTRSEKGSKLCVECASMGCEIEDADCKVFPEKKAVVRRRKREAEPEEYPAAPPPGLESYLSQFE